MSDGFAIKDSGQRQEFEGGMVRDTSEGKIDYTSILFGPMLRRWAAHLTKGRQKYPDPEPGIPNWTLAQGQAEYERAKQSLMRHLFQYLDGDQDEDHAAAIFFNINLMEYVKDRAGRVGNWQLVGDEREYEWDNNHIHITMHGKTIASALPPLYDGELPEEDWGSGHP